MRADEPIEVIEIRARIAQGRDWRREMVLDANFDPLIIERTEHVVVVTLNRPEARNAYDDTMQGELDRAWRAIRSDRSLRAIVLTGTGDVFCAGRDVKELWRYQREGKLVPRYDLASSTYGVKGSAIVEYNVPQPVIAAINGFAVGGGLGMILACDLRVMAETAWLGDLHTGMGQIGGVARLLKELPRSIAVETALAGGRLDATRCYELGLVNRVVATDAVRDSAMEFAERVSDLSPLAVQRTKQLMQSTLQLDAGVTLLEEHYSASIRETADGKEGTQTSWWRTWERRGSMI